MTMARQMDAMSPDPNMANASGALTVPSLDNRVRAWGREPTRDTAAAKRVRCRAGLDARPSLPETIRTCRMWK
jgi:hypothetical protein